MMVVMIFFSALTNKKERERLLPQVEVRDREKEFKRKRAFA